MKTEVISIGTELLLGDTADTNFTWIAQEASHIGLMVYRHSIIGDNRERFRDLLERARKRSDIVIITGGLGPTYDDITKDVVAEVCNQKLVIDDEAKKRLDEYFKTVNKKPSENNLQQAEIPEYATALLNHVGMAAGVWLEHEGTIFILLPGVPNEMKTMFTKEVKPRLESILSYKIFSHDLLFYGIGESKIAFELEDIMKSYTNPTIAPYAKNGEVTVRVRAKANDSEEAEKLMQPIIEKIKEQYGEYLYAIDEKNLEEVVYKTAIKKGITISTAESCTGGLVAKKLTDMPGASNYFYGGACTYSNQAKMNILNVSADTLNKHGAVSPETAIEMAIGARKIYQTDYAVSTTGIAGPDGGSEEKPVGLVYIGIASKDDAYAIRYQASGMYARDRGLVRELASKSALHSLLQAIK